MANAFRNKKTKPYKIEDFMLMREKESRKEPKKKQTIEEMMNMVEILNAAFGGKVVRKDGSS